MTEKYGPGPLMEGLEALRVSVKQTSFSRTGELLERWKDEFGVEDDLSDISFKEASSRHDRYLGRKAVPHLDHLTVSEFFLISKVWCPAALHCHCSNLKGSALYDIYRQCGGDLLIIAANFEWTIFINDDGEVAVASS